MIQTGRDRSIAGGGTERRRDSSRLAATPRSGWRKAQAALEMAIVAPFLLLLFLVIADFGRIFFTYLELIGAARAGAQYGAQNQATAVDTGGMENAAAAAAPGLTLTTNTATCYCACQSGTSLTKSSCADTNPVCGSPPPCSDYRLYVQVNTAATFTTLFSYPGVPRVTNLTAESIMRAE